MMQMFFAFLVAAWIWGGEELAVSLQGFIAGLTGGG